MATERDDDDEEQHREPAPLDVVWLASYEGLAPGDILTVDGVDYLVDDDGVFTVSG